MRTPGAPHESTQTISRIGCEVVHRGLMARQRITCVSCSGHVHQPGLHAIARRLVDTDHHRYKYRTRPTGRATLTV